MARDLRSVLMFYRRPIKVQEYCTISGVRCSRIFERMKQNFDFRIAGCAGIIYSQWKLS